MTTENTTNELSSLASAAAAQRQAIQYFRAGNLRDALTEAKRAADTDRQNTKLQNLVGAISNETHDPGTAIQYLRHSLSIDKNQVEAQFLLGNALSALDLNDEAIQAYDIALSLDPNHVFSYINLSHCLEQLAKFAKAERALHRALDIDPKNPDANGALAEILIRKTQYELAETHAKIAIDSAPDRISLLLTLAQAIRYMNRFEEAEELYRSALHIHPHDASLLVELGSLLREQHLFEAAEKHYESALKIAPKSKKVLRGAAAYFQSIRNFDRSAELYQLYLELNPDDAGMLNNLAIVYRELNKFEEAEQYYLECAERDAQPAYVFNNLGILAMEMAKPKESIEYYRKSLEYNPNYTNAHSNMLFYMNYLDDMTPAELFEEHKSWASWQTDPLLPGADVFPNSPDTDRPIRVGYVSADLYGHAVSYFIESALKHHDTTKFEIYCYAHVSTPDGMTKRLQSYANHWRFITKMKDEEVAEHIREDKIDILVDLGGHTAGNRLQLFALKPAPIQVTWIGYPNTTGLTTIDYRFVDAITDPPGETDKYHTETLWRLPRSFTCYNAQYPNEPSRVLAAEEMNQITFGSFNNASKISNLSVETWARVLTKVKGSRLILKSASLVDEGTCTRFYKMFEKHGISADRVEMYGKMGTNEHMNFYSKIDIGLDPFPYSGTTTSCEALWMNVPIIAMLGDRHAARVTGSLLTQVGLGDLAAENPDQYVQKAVDLANDTDRLKHIHATLREDMINSPLCDHEGHTRDVEDAYRAMWYKWCEAEPGRRKERSRLGRPETAPHRPVLRLLHSLGNYSFVQFCKCIGVMGDVYMLNDLHPLGCNVFPPLGLAQQRYRFFSDEEWKILSKKESLFSKTIARLHTSVEELGGTLVITAWNHLDFVAQPYLVKPAYELGTSDYLKSEFNLKEIFVMRHPISQWSSYCKETNVDVHITVEEFLKGYRHMAEKAVNGMMVRCEDFVQAPEETMKSVCEHLALPYDPEFVNNWPFNLDVPASPKSLCLEDRAHEQLEAPIPSDIPHSVIERMEACADYPIILDLLGYE